MCQDEDQTARETCEVLAEVLPSEDETSLNGLWGYPASDQWNYTWQHITTSDGQNITINLEKAPIARHCNFKAARCRARRSGLFWGILYCACIQTTISQLMIKILTPPLDSVAQICEKRAIIWPSDIFTLWPQPLTLNGCSTSGVTWPNSVSNLTEIEQSAVKLLTI